MASSAATVLRTYSRKIPDLQPRKRSQVLLARYSIEAHTKMGAGPPWWCTSTHRPSCFSNTFVATVLQASHSHLPYLQSLAEDHSVLQPAGMELRRQPNNQRIIVEGTISHGRDLHCSRVHVRPQICSCVACACSACGQAHTSLCCSQLP